MAIYTGTRLAKVITSHCIPTLHSTDLISVESIVMSKCDSQAKAEVAVAAKVRKVLFSTASSAISKMTELSNTLLSVYKEESNEFATENVYHLKLRDTILIASRSRAFGFCTFHVSVKSDG